MMLLDHYVKAGRLCEFLDEIIRIKNNELEDKANWEYFLHKVFDKSYSEFMKEIGKATMPAEPEVMEVEQIETTVKNSMEILESFKM